MQYTSEESRQVFILTHGRTRARAGARGRAIRSRASGREHRAGAAGPGRDPDREPRRELGLADRVARPASYERTAVESPEISPPREAPGSPRAPERE